jgi:hypothetical protein
VAKIALCAAFTFTLHAVLWATLQPFNAFSKNVFDRVGTVRVFRQKVTLEDAIEFHAVAPVETSMRVTNVIPLGCPSLLPVTTVNHVATLKG